jgi:hypothetical protein
MTFMGLNVLNTAQLFCRANKSFSGGPGGRFFKKAPLVAEGK